MVSSMGFRPTRAPRRGPDHRSCLLAALVFTLLAVVWAPASPAFGAPLRSGPSRCTQAPASPVISSVPWPQQRYDLTALGQLTTGAGVVVAVVDSGVDTVAPQLSSAVVPGADLLSGGDGREDCKAHGTAVASIIAARPASGAGLRGLAPAATILPVRVSERTDDSAPSAGAGGVAELTAGIRAAIARRPAVINLSISTTSDNPGLRAAVAEALAADIVVVAAAGNEHDRGNPTPYPAAYDGVVGVGAIGPDSTRVASSQVGSYVDIVAPGTQVVGALPTGGHGLYEGTSFAAPFVSATAALIRARWPGLHQADVVRRLLATADPAPGGRAEYGYGVLDPQRALTEVVLAAGAAPSDSPLPVAAQAPPGSSSRLSPVLAAAGVLLIATAGVAAVAAAVPAGRRRRWRPGASSPSPRQS
jgi:type VII secretion-associated serine protease mycosin